MKRELLGLLGIVGFFTQCAICVATERFVSLAGGHVPPFTTWADAATNIQSAIDAASTADVIWVTNGVYDTGGKIKSGDLVNRVALDKALTVRSVNGADVTVIQGVWDFATNGLAAVRCAWLTNGAILNGFTLRGGATRAVTVALNAQMSGGGVWGNSTNATLINCVISGNAAGHQGGGAYRVSLVRCTLSGNLAVGSGQAGAGIAGAGSGGGAALCNLNGCVVTGNKAIQGDGGGTAYSDLKNCALTKNAAPLLGAGAYQGTLINCTVSGNTAGGYGSYGATVDSAILTNCIIYGNLRVPPFSFTSTNYYNCTLSYCCTEPLPIGPGNITADPQLLGDYFHVAETSPCRGTGTNLSASSDIDGQTWTNPPSIGCDEWAAEPVIGLTPVFAVKGFPAGMSFSGAFAAGQAPFAYYWIKDGFALSDDGHYSSTQTTNLVVTTLGPSDAGVYSLVASNASGLATSAVVRVALHFVDAANASPVPPFTNWASAASTIQDAIDVASAGAIVLVTNGLYSSGGRAMQANHTNRIVLDKPLTVLSVNGPAVTSIRGQWDPTNTNGPLAVRCAWLTNSAVLRGFTLSGGATQTNTTSVLGGGVWGASLAALVAQCSIATNSAASQGGGAYRVSLDQCQLVGNRAQSIGGGADSCALTNCLVAWNSAVNQAGGVASSRGMFNCTVVQNNRGGVDSPVGPIRNSIVYGNESYELRTAFSQISYSCINPFPSGGSNFYANPQFMDGYHLAVTSPCRGAGNPLYSSGADIEGESWANPPSIGCDEVVESAIAGPLAVTSFYLETETFPGRFQCYFAQVNGRASRLAWFFGDGTNLTNASQFGACRTWTNVGDYSVTFTAYNADYPNGVSTNVIVHILPFQVPVLSSAIIVGNNFTFQFAGQSNANYSVQYATNLTPPITWLGLRSLTGTGGVAQVTDTAATNARRFYRVRVQ